MPPPDSYSLRLVSTRRLYDGGTAVAGSPSLAPLVPTAVAGPTPTTSTAWASATGDPVRVRSARGALVLAGRGRRRGAPRGGGGRLQPAGAGPAGAGRNAGRRPHRRHGRRSPTSGWSRSDERRWRRAARHARRPALRTHGVGWFELVVVVIKVLVAFGVLLVSVMLMIWFERKVISDMQSRIGPNRAGPWGLLQTLADGIKLFFKEDLLPERADRFVFKLAPYLSLLPALLIFTVVPVGGIITISGHTFELQVADPPIGILLVLAMSSISVYGVMLAGWSSGSKYPLLGSVRASAQMISYEAALGMTVVTVVLITGSLSTRAIVGSPRPPASGTGT